MSITSDIRSYTDTAVSGGKQVLDSTIASAQTQLNDVTVQAGDVVGKYTATARENVSSIADKATEAVNDLRALAEKAVNLDALKSAVEPYLLQAKSYCQTVTDRAEVLLSGISSDKRVTKLVDAAGSVSGAVVERVQDHVVKPVQSLTGLGAKPAAKPARSPVKATIPATTKPATKPAAKPATRKAPAKRAAKA